MRSIFLARLVFYMLMAYVMMAGFWWSTLLWKRNRELFEVKIELLRAQSNVVSEDAFRMTPGYQAIEKKWKAQSKMILGEGTVLFFIMAIGIVWVSRTFAKEEALARQQSNFMLSVTHELKSPLASVKLILETFLKRTLDKPQTDKLAHHALAEAKRLQALLDNLLLASRLDAHYQIHKEDFRAEPLLTEIVETLKLRFPSAQVTMDSQPDLIVCTDKNALGYIASNLLENALKYSPEPAQVSLSMKREGEDIVLMVADQGFGIPEGERSKIFGKFYRLGNEETRSSKGTGLGLFIVKELSGAIGGKVTYAPNMPKGSVFTVKFR